MWKLKGTYLNETGELVSFDNIVQQGQAFLLPTEVDPKTGKLLGIQYPSSSWDRLSAEEKQKIGLYWVEDAPAPSGNIDLRYYWPSGKERELEDKQKRDADGQLVLDENGAPVIGHGLKGKAIKQAEQTQSKLLQEIDWYFQKDSRLGVGVPIEIKAYDQAVRKAGKRIESSISACESLPEFIVLHEPVQSDDFQIIAAAPVHDWPMLEKAADYVADYVPESVPMLDALSVLMEESNNKGNYYDQMIAFLDSESNPLASLKFQRAGSFRRNDDLVKAGLAHLSISEAEEVRLFRKMAGIVDESTDTAA